MATVTIVMATYNRPKLLRHSVEAILRQSYSDWLLLVVGDGCDAQTAETMESFNDDRIFYHNLTTRCGEQSGPNMAGASAAKTDYIAFCNHDDIWLPDHLEHAMSILDRGYDFYCGAAALTATATVRQTNETRPVFWERTPKGRSLKDLFLNQPVLLEPVSSWVMHRSVLDKVGLWSPASQIYRTPLEEWALRAWRKGIEAYLDDQITVIYCNAEKNVWLNKEKKGHLYAGNDVESAFWNERISGLSNEAIRDWIDSELPADGQKRSWTFFKKAYEKKAEAWMFEGLLTPAAAEIYRQHGWDAHAQVNELLGSRRGNGLALMLERRTGEELGVHESWENVAAEARKCMQGDARWRRMNNSA